MLWLMGAKGKNWSSVRFLNLVKDAGKPKQALLWSAPEKDSNFMKALRENRIVTVVQPNVGTKKDFGTVGFEKERNASYLVFPKKLPVPEGTKIIGIKYNLLEQSEPEGPLYKPKVEAEPGIAMRDTGGFKADKKKIAQTSRHSTKVVKAREVYTAEVDLVARESRELQVEAVSLAEAKELLRTELAGIQINAENANVSKRLKSVKKA